MAAFIASILSTILGPFIKILVDEAVAQIKAAAAQSQLNSLSKNQAAFNAAYALLNAAQTTEEKANAADMLAKAWLSRD